MQFAMLFDAPAQPEPRREKAKAATRPVVDTPCATLQTALTLAAPRPAPQAITPKPVLVAAKAALPVEHQIVEHPTVERPTVERPTVERPVAPLPQPTRPMRYVVQAFNRGRQGLVAETPLAMRDANMACSRAETLAQRKAGVIAYAVPADAGEDDYPDARILARFGLCPESED